MQLKERAYHRELTVRKLKHDVDTSVYVVNRSKEGTQSQEDQLSAERNSTHSQIEIEPAAKWDTRCLGNKPNRLHALLGAARLIFDPIRW